MRDVAATALLRYYVTRRCHLPRCTDALPPTAEHEKMRKSARRQCLTRRGECVQKMMRGMSASESSERCRVSRKAVLRAGATMTNDICDDALRHAARARREYLRVVIRYKIAMRRA